MKDLNNVSGGVKNLESAIKRIVRYKDNAGVNHVIEVANTDKDEETLAASVAAIEKALQAKGFVVESSNVEDALEDVTGGLKAEKKKALAMKLEPTNILATELFDTRDEAIMALMNKAIEQGDDIDSIYGYLLMDDSSSSILDDSLKDLMDLAIPKYKKDKRRK